MKQNWEVKKLGKVCDFQNGFAFKSKTYKEDGQPILRITNIQNQSLEINDLVYFHENDYKENFERFKVYKDDLVIAMSGATTGKLGINKSDIVFYLNQRVGKFIPKENLSKPYLYYFLSTKVEESLRIAAGAAQPNLSTEQINNFEIPLPPLQEQQRIVAILDEAFTAIDKAKANTEQNLKNTKELFESELQRVFSEKGNGWEEKKLKDISNIFGRGKSKHRPRGDSSLLGGKYPLIQTGDISNSDHWINTYSQTYNEKGLAQSKLWPKGTICIAIVGSNVAETAILNFDACFPDSVIGIEVNPIKANNQYVDYLLQSFKTLLKEKGKGTARDNINLGTFENQKFPFPNIKYQQTIVSKLDALREQTKKLEAVYEKKLQDLEELKKSVLSKAFSGEL